MTTSDQPLIRLAPRPRVTLRVLVALMLALLAVESRG